MAVRFIRIGANPKLAAEVAGHNNHRVAEVHRAALTVGQTAIIQQLQQGIEDLRVGFFDLVKQHHAVGAAADRFGQLAAFFKPNITGRRAEEPADGVFLLIFGHINPHHGVFVIEEESRQGAGQFRLADAGRTEEDERADWPVGVLQAGPGAPDGVGDQADRFILADDPLMQTVFHVHQFFHLAFQQAGYRDAGPVADHLGDLFRVHFLFQQGRFFLQQFEFGFGLSQLAFQVMQGAIAQAGRRLEVGMAFSLFDLGLGLVNPAFDVPDLLDGLLLDRPAGIEFAGGFPQVGQIFFQVGQTFLGGFVFFFLQGLPFNFQLHDRAVHFIQRLGLGVDLRAETGRSFINQVNGLIGEVAVGDIAVGKGRRSDHSGVRDADAVMHLIALFEAAQDADRVLHGGFRHQHGLEPPFEGGVFLDVFPVFVQRGCADHVQFATGQHRFEHVAGVHCAFSGARAHHGVHLINEQDDLAG